MYDIDQLIIHEYSGQTGYGSLPYFVGRQYGQGWLRNIARVAFPFLKKALGFVGNIASNTAEDLIHNENKSFADSLKEHAVGEVQRVLKRKPDSTINRGGSLRKRPKLIV
jgi:hypothetical protein